jgi:hypothetical protein
MGARARRVYTAHPRTSFGRLLFGPALEISASQKLKESKKLLPGGRGQ